MDGGFTGSRDAGITSHYSRRRLNRAARGHYDSTRRESTRTSRPDSMSTYVPVAVGKTWLRPLQVCAFVCMMKNSFQWAVTNSHWSSFYVPDRKSHFDWNTMPFPPYIIQWVWEDSPHFRAIGVCLKPTMKITLLFECVYQINKLKLMKLTIA